MSNPDMLDALQALAVDKGITVDVLFAVLADALESAYKRLPNAYEYAWVAIDPDNVEMFRVMAQELDEDGEPTGPELEVTPPKDVWGRIAAQTFRQVMNQRIREAEREMQVRGVREPRGRHRHRHHPAERQPLHAARPRARSRRCCRRPSRCPTSGPSPTPGSRPTSSRSARRPRARRSWSAAPTPASSSGSSSSRCPRSPTASSRSRPAPASRATARRSPCGPTTTTSTRSGACVGARGARVRMVVNELRGEKIDIVPFSEDPADFVAKALSPAKVKEVRIHEDTGVAEVIVPDYQLSLAIGKEGQNARLAARLTGWRVDIKSETQLAEEEAYARRGLGRGRVGRQPRDRRAGVAAGRGWRGRCPPSSGTRPRSCDRRGARRRPRAAADRGGGGASRPRRIGGRRPARCRGPDDEPASGPIRTCVGCTPAPVQRLVGRADRRGRSRRPQPPGRGAGSCRPGICLEAFARVPRGWRARGMTRPPVSVRRRPTSDQSDIREPTIQPSPPGAGRSAPTDKD